MTERADVRPAVSLLLAASGVTLIAAARERWWPACQWPDFNSPSCLTIQDDSFGSISSPWVQAGNTGVLQAISIALLGFAIALLPLVWVRRPVALIVLSTGALAISSMVVAGSVYYETVTGGPSDFVGLYAATIVWALGWPLYLVVTFTSVLGAPYVGRWPRGTGWRLAFLSVLLLATPLLQLFVAPLVVGYTSYDATPWADAVSGGFLVLAALLVWPATANATARRRLPQGVSSTGASSGTTFTGMPATTES